MDHTCKEPGVFPLTWGGTHLLLPEEDHSEYSVSQSAGEYQHLFRRCSRNSLCQWCAGFGLLEASCCLRRLPVLTNVLLKSGGGGVEASPASRTAVYISSAFADPCPDLAGGSITPALGREVLGFRPAIFLRVENEESSRAGPRHGKYHQAHGSRSFHVSLGREDVRLGAGD